MKSFSKSRNELLKARVVNFNGNIDKAADVTVFAVVFSFSSVFESSMPNTDVIEELGEKKGGWPLLSSCKEKTLLNCLYVAYVNSTRCAHHMCRAYFSKSLYLSLFVFCHGK